MKWAGLRSLVTGKLAGSIEKGKKHDKGWVPAADGTFIGFVKIGHHVHMRPNEIGGCARSLFISEANLKELERCNISREEFLRLVAERLAQRG